MTIKVAVPCGSAIFKRGGWEATGSTKKKKHTRLIEMLQEGTREAVQATALRKR